MKKIFYIFRHGQTNYNLEKRVQSSLDIPLNNQGIIQAEELAKNLSDVQFDCIYTSPLSRSQRTAEIVVGKKSIKIIPHSGLRERNFGILCGKIMNITDEPANTHIDTSKDIINIPASLLFSDDYTPQNGESDKMFIKRACDTLFGIAKNTTAQTIGISTHAGVIGAFVRTFTNFDFSGVPNAEYLKLQWDGESFTLPEQAYWLSKMKQNQITL